MLSLVNPRYLVSDTTILSNCIIPFIISRKSRSRVKISNCRILKTQIIAPLHPWNHQKTKNSQNTKRKKKKQNVQYILYFLIFVWGYTKVIYDDTIRRTTNFRGRQKEKKIKREMYRIVLTILLESSPVPLHKVRNPYKTPSRDKSQFQQGSTPIIM